MNHEALICKIKVTPHPNADRLAVGHVFGETVIVGKDTPDGALGVYFPCETQLGEEFATLNDLIRRKDEDGNPAGGMFEPNRRVRIQKLRGVKSYGFWTPIENLSVLGNYSHLKDGDTVSTINGKVVCQKYVTPTTKSRQNITYKLKKTYPWFPQHEDTQQLKYNVGKLKAGDPVVVNLKMHGSSQRVGWNYDYRRLKFRDQVAKFFGVKVDELEMRKYNGTRRVVLEGNENGFYSEEWREKVAERLYPFLEPHMQIFFETVGYENGNLIMPAHLTSKSSDKSLKEQYGDEIKYVYNCKPGQFDIYVYRIAYILPNGHVVDLTWDQVIEKCVSWDVKHVPEMDRFIYDGDPDRLIEYIESISDGPDLIDPSHIREGVCVRVNSSEWKCFKNKGWDFKVMEGIAKESDSYIDMEEIS